MGDGVDLGQHGGCGPPAPPIEHRHFLLAIRGDYLSLYYTWCDTTPPRLKCRRSVRRDLLPPARVDATVCTTAWRLTLLGHHKAADRHHRDHSNDATNDTSATAAIRGRSGSRRRGRSSSHRRRSRKRCNHRRRRGVRSADTASSRRRGRSTATASRRLRRAAATGAGTAPLSTAGTAAAAAARVVAGHQGQTHDGESELCDFRDFDL